MHLAFFPAALAACALALPLTAQAPDAPAAGSRVELRYAGFDPLVSTPEVPATLRSRGNDGLWIVQFDGKPTEEGRQAVRAAGGQIHGYLPYYAYVVRMAPAVAPNVEALADVRWVGRYHAAYRLEPELIAEHLAGDGMPTRRYNMVVVDKHNDKPALGASIRALGGVVDNEHDGSLLFTATLTGAQLLQVARLDQVLWIDRWTPDQADVNNARIQGGANYVETNGGWSGAGINAHIYEGIHNHVAFSGGVTNVLSGGSSTGHGTNTAGIVFGDGTGNPTFRGFAPDVGKFYTTYQSPSTSRYNVVRELVNNRNVSHTTASWGGGRTLNYTSISADADDIIFDHDIAWTQSQSNAGNQMSRPQAWAKNIFSIGGFAHRNNSNPLDDSWQAGNASTGPASDGRIKPTLAAYYEAIGTTSSSSGYTTSFGGTSGATPIIAGHNILAIDMFTTEVSPGVGLFGQGLRNPGGSKHSNRPHFTTLKALQVASARQYPFTSASVDNRREHMGWGYPDLRRMYDYRDKTFIVDETDVLQQNDVTRWDINVAPGETELRIVMHHAEPAGNPSAQFQIVNNLSISATDPNGVLYWGNNALEQGNFSVPGGTEDAVNPIEVIVVQNPPAGVWHVDVKATLVVQDTHVETAQVDADYGLVVSGGTGQGGGPVVLAAFTEFGQGCPGSPSTFAYCAELNANGGTLAGTMRTDEIAYFVAHSGTSQVTSVDIYTRSTTGGTVTVPAHIYSIGPSATPIASTTMMVGPTPGFYTATFATPVPVTSSFYFALDHSSGNVEVSDLSGGVSGFGFFRPTPGTGAWSILFPLTPAIRVTCSSSTTFLTPDLANQGLPVLGTSYTVTLADALPSSFAVSMIGFSDTTYNNTPLPAPLPNAPGCNVQVAPEVTVFQPTTAAGTATDTFTVPNMMSFVGLELFHQWAVLDAAANNLGIVVSDAGKARVGQ